MHLFSVNRSRIPFTQTRGTRNDCRIGTAMADITERRRSGSDATWRPNRPVLSGCRVLKQRAYCGGRVSAWRPARIHRTYGCKGRLASRERLGEI